ncbi:MAG: hypothetical protein JY451_13515 [Erythrobacter sp.]|nr:MAG: hypothetical protein JY451_13515 [Erythrobacter sp.]
MNFQSFMPNAAKVLFAIGWVLGIATLIGSVAIGSSGFGGRNFIGAILIGLTAAINAAVIPWIGAALIWRADKFLEKPE